VYLKESSDCICERGFTPVDNTEALADGFSDCQQIIVENCLENQILDANGKCKEPTDCSAQCNGSAGTI